MNPKNYRQANATTGEAEEWLDFRYLKASPVGYFEMDFEPWYRKLSIWPKALWYGLVAHRFHNELGLF